MHSQWGRVDALRDSQSIERFSVQRIKTVTSLRQTHSQRGCDLRFLKQAQ